MVRALIAEFEDAGVLESFLGQNAIRLARLVETGKGTDAAVASVNRELRAAREDAMALAHRPNSPVTKMRDELAARRERRGA